MLIAEHVFGAEWLARNMWGSSIREAYGSETKRPYLQSKIGDSQTMLRSYYRIIELVNLVLAFQRKRDLRPLIERLFRCGLEETIAELRVAQRLKSWGVEFCFRKEIGTKGLDYDLDIRLRNGAWAAAEIKCKLNSTEFSANGLKSTLKKAKDQLPQDRPGIIFIEIPQSWLALHSNAGVIVRKAIHDFLKKTTRINSIIEMICYVPDDITEPVPLWLVAERANSKCKFGYVPLLDYSQPVGAREAAHEVGALLYPAAMRKAETMVRSSDVEIPDIIERYGDLRI